VVFLRIMCKLRYVLINACTDHPRGIIGREKNPALIISNFQRNEERIDGFSTKWIICVHPFVV
jgi:hypothetical protein